MLAKLWRDHDIAQQLTPLPRSAHPRIAIFYYRTKSFACKTLARPRYCAAINSISAVCASSRSVFYVIGNCIAISYYIKKATTYRDSLKTFALFLLLTNNSSYTINSSVIYRFNIDTFSCTCSVYNLSTTDIHTNVVYSSAACIKYQVSWFCFR